MNNQKNYIVIACIAIVFILGILFVIKPFFLEIKDTAVIVLESRERLISLETMDKRYVEEIEKERVNINARLIEVKKQLIDKNEAVKFFEALEAIASSTDNGIEINASEFPSLTLSISGEFPGLMKFLGWLENGDYFINIDSVNISKIGISEDSENISSGKIKTTLKITAYTGQ